MAFSGLQTPIAMRAATDLDVRQFHIVELHTVANDVVLPAAGQFFGVLQNHPRSLEAATVVHEGVTKVKAGNTVGVGNFITSAATGFAIAVGSGDLPTLAYGRALTAAASGFLFTLVIGQTTTLSGNANNGGA